MESPSATPNNQPTHRGKGTWSSAAGFGADASTGADSTTGFGTLTGDGVCAARRAGGRLLIEQLPQFGPELTDLASLKTY